jgi:hypothetical protein
VSLSSSSVSLQLPGTFPQSIPGFNTNGMSLGQILDSPQGIAGGYQPAPTMYGGVSIPYSNAYNFSLCVLNGPGDYNYQLTNVNAYMPGACNGFSYTNMSFQPTGVPTLLEQCKTEQKYTRGAMMRSLLYNQVSISGQALVFVVRTQEWSVMARAGTLTYMAFILAQVWCWHLRHVLCITSVPLLHVVSMSNGLMSINQSWWMAPPSDAPDFPLSLWADWLHMHCTLWLCRLLQPTLSVHRLLLLPAVIWRRHPLLQWTGPHCSY